MYLGCAQIALTDRWAKVAKKRLTLPVFDVADPDNPEMCEFYFDEGEYRYIPRVYASQLGIDYETAAGAPLDIPNQGALRPDQIPWVDEVLGLFTGGATDVVAEARTGFGKTFCSVEIARRLGRTTLILVDQDFLRDQWIATFVDQFGVAREDIGIIQGKKREWDKPVAIAMVQTLYRMDAGTEGLANFGTAIYDEMHSIGAKQYSRVMALVPAKYRLGVSATPTRTDVLDKVIKWHLGDVQVVLRKKHAKSQVRIVASQGCYSWYANTSPKTGRYLQEVSNDGRRNALLARVITRLWEKDRRILAIGDRIEQLENIMAVCAFMGVPKEDMGLVAGYRSEWCLAKDTEPKRKPEGYVAGTLYTPVKMQLVRKRIPKKVLETTKNESKIIFATYGMFRKGVDVPELDAGVDCTPVSKIEQVHGRILRTKKGKKMPIWVTLRDSLSQRAEYQLSCRLTGYLKSNAEIVLWDLEKGIAKLDPSLLRSNIKRNLEQLKKSRIVKTSGGSYTIETKSFDRR